MEYVYSQSKNLGHRCFWHYCQLESEQILSFRIEFARLETSVPFTFGRISRWAWCTETQTGRDEFRLLCRGGGRIYQVYTPRPNPLPFFFGKVPGEEKNLGPANKILLEALF